MAIGIWTPTVGSTEQIVFDVLPRPNDGANTVKQVAAKTGAHLLIINETCNTIFWSATAPANVVVAAQGVPIPSGVKFVIPNPNAISYIYAPYALGLIQVAAGTMT